MATIVAVAIVGGGATIVHLYDIVATGNLAPGNTIQNVGNLLDPALLVGLTWLASRQDETGFDRTAFLNWQRYQQPIATLTAAGIGIGFAVGFALGGLLLWTLVGTLLGVGIGNRISNRILPLEGVD